MKIAIRFWQYHFLWVILLAAIVGVSKGALAQSTSAETNTMVTIRDDVWLYDAKRLGLNIGSPDRFGAGQYLKNFIANPGLEASEFATLFLVAQGSSATRVIQDNWETKWNSNTVGQPEGFWVGAEYEFLTGPLQGVKGEVTRFTHEEGRYTYELAPKTQPANRPNIPNNTNPNPEDVVALRHKVAGYLGDTSPFSRADTTTTRPGSAGRQSLRLLPADNEWRPSYGYYMDSYWRDGDNSAGKLFRIQGNMHFEVWAKGSKNGDQLELLFQRQGLTPFVRQTFTLTTEWQKYRTDFFVSADADPLVLESNGKQNPVLELTLRIVQGSGEAWIDDIGLWRGDYQNPSDFTDRYVDFLRSAQPGIIRNWGGQLGSSLANELADPYARKTTAHSPRDRVALNYSFSLHQFLQLAHTIEAEPWYVIPPTFTAEEMQGLLDYLAAPAGSSEWADRRVALGQTAPWTEVFPVIHLEFGNEMWGANNGGDPFLGATVRGGQRLGQIASTRFEVLRTAKVFSADKFNLIIGGQFGYTERQQQIEEESRYHNSIALAPYFGLLDSFQTDEQIFYSLFARAYQDVRVGDLLESAQYVSTVGQATGMAIYEINFHTTEGDVPLSVRNGFVTGLNGGLALPLYMLSYQKWLGIKNQAAFTAVQFSYRMKNGEYARLWGMLRDLEATGWKRPTWLGLELANKAIRGDMMVTVHTGDTPTWVQEPINGIKTYMEVPFIQSFAFREGKNSAVVLFNLDLKKPRKVTLQLPHAPDAQAILHTLNSNSIHDNNESSLMVRTVSKQITDFAQTYELILPAHSLHVLEWGELGESRMYIAPTPTPRLQPTPSLTPLPDLTATDEALLALTPTPIIVNGVAVTMTPTAIMVQGTGVPNDDHSIGVESTGVTSTPILVVVDGVQVTATPSAIGSDSSTSGGSAEPLAQNRPTEQFTLIGSDRFDSIGGAILPGNSAVQARQNRRLLTIIGLIGGVNVVVLGAAAWMIAHKKEGKG